jgi:hypothetical protein
MVYKVKKITQVDTSSLENLGRSVVDLSKYTEDEFGIVSQALQATDADPILYNSPPKPRRGTYAYADGTHWNPGAGEGPYYFNGTAWIPMGVTGRIQMLTITRNTAAAVGNVAYTGLLFKPRALAVTGGLNGTSEYITYVGFAESQTPASGSTSAFGTTGGAVNANFIQIGDASSGNNIFANVASFDAAGFTLSWGKTGTPAAGTATFYVLCFE